MADLGILPPALRIRVDHSLGIIDQALDTYKPGELSVSYNGGKDSCVMVHLLNSASLKIAEERYIAFSKRNRSLSELFAIYFRLPNSFPEVTTFAQESAARYGFNLFISDKSYKAGLEQMLEEHSALRAIFMGTRRGDPHGDPGWPPLMRINPILDWSYADVWQFLRLLSVPYCTLYDKGYTSIGLVHDTVPNTKLRREDGTYEPAWALVEEAEERAGRTSKSSL